MHGLNNADPGMTIDWGKTSLDYAKHLLKLGNNLNFISH